MKILRLLVAVAGQGAQPARTARRRCRHPPTALGPAVELVGEHDADVVDAPAHRRGEAVDRRLRAADRDELLLVHRRDLRASR